MARWLSVGVLLLGLGGPLEAQSSLLVENVTLVDGTGRPPVGGASVLVIGDRIARIERGSIAAPPGARRIDGRGRFLVPGLIDVHVHLRGAFEGGPPPSGPSAEGLAALHGYLYAGVTTIFDAGNDPDFIFDLREKERRGAILAPRIFATGRLVTAPDGHGARLGVTVEDFARDRSKLDAHIARGPDLVKLTQDEHGWGTRPLIGSMPAALLERIVRYYHEHGIRTTIHTSNELRTWEAVYAGVDSLAHPVIQAPVSERYLAMMKVKKIPQASTLTIGEGYSRLAENPDFLDEPLYRATVDPAEIVRLRTEEARRQAERRWTAWMKVMTPVAQDNLRRLHEAGGIVALGTDQSLGAAVHRELELLVEGGIPPLAALTIATRNAARFLGKEDELGTIEPGKKADLVLLAADPTADIRNARAIELVVKGGRIVDRTALAVPANREPPRDR